MTNTLLRIWLPDRPGSLGQVASIIGSAGADIVGLDVLESSEHVAVDEFALVVASDVNIEAITKSINDLDGFFVEEVRNVGAFPDPRTDALELAEAICNATSPAQCYKLITDHLLGEFICDWTALCSKTSVVASSGSELPSESNLAALASGINASPLVASGHSGPEDIAAANLPNAQLVLLLSRSSKQWRQRERQQVQILARIADRVVALVQ